MKSRLKMALLILMAMPLFAAPRFALAAYDLIEVLNVDPTSFPVPIPTTAQNIRIFLFAPSTNSSGELAFNASASWTITNPPAPLENFGVNVLIKHSGTPGDPPEVVYVGLRPTDDLCVNNIPNPTVTCIAEPGIGGGTLAGAVINDTGEIAFGTGFFGTSLGETVKRIQKGNGSQAPETLMERGQIGDAVYNFPVGNPGSSFNNSGYVASVMWGDCDAAQVGELRAYWMSNGGPVEELFNNCNPGETVTTHYPIALQPDGTRAAFPGATSIVQNPDGTATVTGFGVYVADPLAGVSPTLIAPLDAFTFGSAAVRVAINNMGMVAYSGIDPNNPTLIERVWYVDSTNAGATPTVVTDSSAEVAINNTGKIAFLGAQPGINSGLFVYDIATDGIETVLTTGLPYPNSNSTITGINWWREGFNDSNELVAQLTLDNDPFTRVVVKLVPSAGIADISVTDDVDVADDMMAGFGTVAINNTETAAVTVVNSGTAPLTIISVSAVTAPFALTDGCTGQTIDPGAAGCTVTVSLSPTQAGNFNDTFDITSTDPDESPLTFAVTGDAPAPPPPNPNPGPGANTNSGGGGNGAVDPFVIALMLMAMACTWRRKPAKQRRR